MHGSSVTELHCSNALHRFLPLTLDEVLVTYSEPLDALIMIPDGPLLAVNTASGQKSIWQHLNYDQFRTKVVALERASKEVPCDRKFHQRKEWHNPRICNNDPSRLLPFEVEQRVADDFAFLAAAEEGAKGVSAVGLEESTDPLGLVIRLAANGFVPQIVPGTFKAIFDLLHRCAIKSIFNLLQSNIDI